MQFPVKKGIVLIDRAGKKKNRKFGSENRVKSG
jgi:hypothetical protein